MQTLLEACLSSPLHSLVWQRVILIVTNERTYENKVVLLCDHIRARAVLAASWTVSVASFHFIISFISFIYYFYYHRRYSFAWLISNLHSLFAASPPHVPTTTSKHYPAAQIAFTGTASVGTLAVSSPTLFSLLATSPHSYCGPSYCDDEASLPQVMEGVSSGRVCIGDLHNCRSC
uniref:Uncharacterized protein n=1 Tax=Trypanosoma vivax (strain Y486) TaxID=1055687 RepID=G0UBU4_TRYVY|nr:hypothetical protein TVY486_1107760 [Trypanosoma vivax Y486]